MALTMSERFDFDTPAIVNCPRLSVLENRRVPSTNTQAHPHGSPVESCRTLPEMVVVSRGAVWFRIESAIDLKVMYWPPSTDREYKKIRLGSTISESAVFAPRRP